MAHSDDDVTPCVEKPEVMGGNAAKKTTRMSVQDFLRWHPQSKVMADARLICTQQSFVGMIERNFCDFHVLTYLRAYVCIVEHLYEVPYILYRNVWYTTSRSMYCLYKKLHLPRSKGQTSACSRRKDFLSCLSAQKRKCFDRESNTGPSDLQSDALPTELSKHRYDKGVSQCT